MLGLGIGFAGSCIGLGGFGFAVNYGNCGIVGRGKLTCVYIRVYDFGIGEGYYVMTQGGHIYG